MINRLIKKLALTKIKFQNFIFFLYNRNCIIDKKYLILGTPEYGNLGDHLIAYAELQLLYDLYGMDQVQELTENDIRYRFRKVCKSIKNDTILVLQGGGNISDIWIDQEKIREKLVRKFPHNKIIIMPQTVYISDKDKVALILNKYCDNVLICAREKFTYDLLKRQGKKTMICPDVALYLWDKCKHFRNEHKREGIGICLRNDEESVLSKETDTITAFIKKNHLNPEIFSTVTDNFISAKQRREKIMDLLVYISDRELIITDRLHAMIMSYLTGTPCIAFANSNHKVEGCYEWISNADNIFFAKDVETGLRKVCEYIGKKNNSDFKYSDMFLKIFESE